MLPSVVLADVTGSILGMVTDSSSAVIQGAQVTATNLDVNLVVETTTDATGQFRFLALPVGRYKVGANSPGFRPFVMSGIVLSVNDRRRVDIVLEVAAGQQEITVSANPVEVETTNTQLGDVIEQKKIVELPLNGRSYLDLLGLQHPMGRRRVRIVHSVSAVYDRRRFHNLQDCRRSQTAATVAIADFLCKAPCHGSPYGNPTDLPK